MSCLPRSPSWGPSIAWRRRLQWQRQQLASMLMIRIALCSPSWTRASRRTAALHEGGARGGQRKVRVGATAATAAAA
eukprot:4709078-Pyramimonas_sp.AAC.1